MSQSGSQAAAFFRDVREYGVVWLVRDDDGSPTHLSADGTRSFPFWSTSHRAQRAAKIWGRGLRVDSMPLDAWCDLVLPDAARRTRDRHQLEWAASGRLELHTQGSPQPASGR
ncbi:MULTISPECIES: DUF2750 domain-containing protein [unclassified Streptomyces]|uniref:DUF2750 domain-containing protein n=1 Tax=unclassified Streptomyces TaxID=2593676 RepID=UPI0018F8863B